MQRFQNLLVWQKSHQFVLDIYRFTMGFPAIERYGLTSQLRRAAASVPANIAEGSKRASRKDFARILNIAEGSLAECSYLLMLSHDLRYLQDSKITALLADSDEIGRMLHGLRIRVVRDDQNPDSSSTPAC